MSQGRRVSQAGAQAVAPVGVPPASPAHGAGGGLGDGPDSSPPVVSCLSEGELDSTFSRRIRGHGRSPTTGPRAPALCTGPWGVAEVQLRPRCQVRVRAQLRYREPCSGGVSPLCPSVPWAVTVLSPHPPL